VTTTLIFLGVLTTLILVHELGHFLTAKAYGVKVLEFGLGFPPRLFSIRKGETVYSLNVIPLGGFVRLLGEQDPTDPRSLASRGIIPRIIILSAGVFMNVLLPLVIFTIMLVIPYKVVEGRVQIIEVAPNSPASQSGLRGGDFVDRVDGAAIKNISQLAKRIHLNLGEDIRWDITREKYRMTGNVGSGGDPGLTPRMAPIETNAITTYLKPRWKPPEGEGNVGVVISTTSPRLVTQSEPIWEAIPHAARKVLETLKLFRNEIVGLIIGSQKAQFAGPVGIAQVSGEVARAGLAPLLELTALLSLNLAIINILPIPALDGGRLIFVFLEWVRRGKRIRPEREGLVHLVGFVVLVSIIIVITYFDVLRIVRGESLLG
jgi:regulator of sigma E protease